MSDTFSQTIDALKAVQVTNYTAVSALALLSYDIALTQRLEIKHIWWTKWSLPQAMYLFCRYFAIALLVFNVAVDVSATPSEMICAAYMRITGFGPQALAIVTDAVLLIRLRSMYHNSKKVTLFLAVLFAMQALIETIVIGFATTDPVIRAPPPLSGLHLGCLYRNYSPHYILVVWIASLAFATLLFGMTLYKLWEYQKADGKAGDLLVLFAQDGAIFFGMISCLLLLGTLLVGLAPEGRLQDVGVPWLVAAYGIVTSRLILNVREYSARTSLIATKTTSLRLSSLEIRVRSPTGQATTESHHRESRA